MAIDRARTDMAGSPTQRTLAEMRRRGYPLVQVTEHWNGFAKRRIDLFNIIDVLCVSETEVVGVQTTSADNVSHRIAKMTESEALPILRKAGVRVLVHGWRKSARTKRWELREVDIS